MDFDEHNTANEDASIAVSFSIAGDFDPSYVTQRIGIEPTRIAIKGSVRPAPNCLPVYSGWSIKEGYLSRDEFLNLDMLVDRIRLRFTGKENAMRLLIAELGIKASLVILVRISLTINQIDFGFGLNQDNVRFLASVDAEIEFAICSTFDLFPSLV